MQPSGMAITSNTPKSRQVGTVAYLLEIYDTWDPNWRGFIGTSFIIALEELPRLINADMTKLMHASPYNSTVEIAIGLEELMMTIYILLIRIRYAPVSKSGDKNPANLLGTHASPCQ